MNPRDASFRAGNAPSESNVEIMVAGEGGGRRGLIAILVTRLSHSTVH